MSSAPSRSSADPFADALARAVGAILERLADVALPNPVVLIDGRSGAGKTSLARRLVARWPRRDLVQCVCLDALYPGWDGLADGVDYAREHVLVPHGRGAIGVWQRWDWNASQRLEAYAVDPALALIVEGSGMITPSTARLGDMRVWVDAPDPARRRRALARDGAAYGAHWDRWARQEEQHIADDDPRALADLIVALP